MRSPYERQPRHSPPPDDRDMWMARLDPTGERAAAEVDRDWHSRGRTPALADMTRADMVRHNQQTTEPQANRPGVLVFKEPEA